MEFITYSQALELKKLGFDEPCFGYYGETQKLIWKSGYAPWTNSERNLVDNHFTAAPLKQQAFRWFRDNHNLFGCIDLQCSNPAYWYIRVDDIIENDFVYHSEDYRIKYKTYEEAELACTDKLIQIVKNKP
jgi:hypothetical protein